MERAALHASAFALLAWLLVAPARADDQPQEQFWIAAGHYAAQRWELASDGFLAFLDAQPQHPRAGDAVFYLGECQVQLGRYDEARTHFSHLLTKNPESRFARQALFRSGEAALLGGKADSARKDLEKFYAVYPGDELGAFVLPYLGEIAAGQEDHARAQKLYTEALQEFPHGPLKEDCQLGLARSLEQNNRLVEAQRLLRLLADDAEGRLADQAQFQLGMLHYNNAKYEQALAAWEALERTFPQSPLRPRARLGRGWVLYQLERYGEAQERLSTLVQDEAIGVEAQYWLGLALRAQEQWKKAAETLLAAAGADESHELLPAIRFYAGDSLLHVGDRATAQRQFDLVLEQAPESRWAREALFGKLQAAYEAENHGDVDRLALDFQRRFPDSPLKGQSQLLRAAALKGLGRFEESADCLRDALAAAADDAPQHINVRGELVLCYLKLNRLDEARVALDDLLARSPSHPVVLAITRQLAEAAFGAGERQWASQLYRHLATDGHPPEFVVQGLAGLGWSLMCVDDFEGAAPLFTRILKQHPHSALAPEAALALGQILQEQDRPEEALAMYHLVVQEYPQSDEVSEALLRAARIHGSFGESQQAAALYDRLISEHGKFAHLDAALYGLAWSLMELDRAAEAHEHFQRLHDEFPKSKFWADATYRLAKKASDEQQYDLAAGLLAELVKRQPEKDVLVHALYLQGRIALKRELWEEVEPAMARLVRESPDSSLRLPAEYSIAEAAYQQGQLEQAGALLARLDEEIQGRTETWMAMIPLRLAQVLADQKQWDRAAQVAADIQQRFPTFQRQYEADYLAGLALAAGGDFDSAREAYQRVIRSPEGSKTETAAMAQWMIGESYFHQQDFETARREFLRTEILYGYPKWQAAALLEAGRCHEALAQWKEAADLYNRVLKKYPNTASAEQARQRLLAAER